MRSTVGLIVENLPGNLFICEDGKNHQESFETLLAILGSIFSREKVKPPKISKGRLDDGSYKIIKVTTGYLGKQWCAVFQIQENILLVKRSHSSLNIVKDWIEQIRYYSL
ncbi:hypothetical protein J7K24_02060 [bacterium]|nr:hypothetical protein [bacterium]